jgi:hypothetical protein
MSCTEELRARILAAPSAAVIAHRRRLIEEIRRLQTSIAPLTVHDLRRESREEEEATYGRGRGIGS